jgi:HNH endonuclease
MSLTNFSNKDMLKLAAWNKAQIDGQYDPKLFRKDRFGNWIKWTEHGQQTLYGWEIDHVVPVSWGGRDHPQNVAATYWLANRKKSNLFVG